MHKYRAKFTAGWLECECKANSLEGIIDQLNATQDLGCLVRMGLYMEMGTKHDIPVLRRLEAFIEKYENAELTEQDIQEFHYPLSLGNLVCTEFEIINAFTNTHSNA